MHLKLDMKVVPGVETTQQEIRTFRRWPAETGEWLATEGMGKRGGGWTFPAFLALFPQMHSFPTFLCFKLTWGIFWI